MARVFISYRRADTATFTGRIYDRLVAKLGKKNVFKDVDNIPPGVDFPHYIQESLSQCAVVLVVIGPKWLDYRVGDSGRRLDDHADFVRQEIETAFAQGLTIIPLLVDGATMPSAASLPETLQRLARINAIEVRNDPDFARDMEQVVAAIEGVFAAQPKRSLFGRRAAPASQPSAPPVEPQPAPSPYATRSPYASSAPASFAERAMPGMQGPPQGGASPGWNGPSYGPAGPAFLNAQQRDMFVARPEGAISREDFGPRPRLKVNRLLAAPLAALLIVVSFLTVLSLANGGTLPIGRILGTSSSGHRPTQTVPATLSMEDARGTALAKASFPYSAAAPGKPCDDGVAGWTQGPGLSCPDDPPKRTHMKDGVSIIWNYVTSIPTKTSYSVRVNILNITPGETAKLQVIFLHPSGTLATRSDTYAVQLDGDGSAFAEWNTGSPQQRNVSFDPRGPVTVSISVNDSTSTVTCKIKDTEVCNYKETESIYLGEIGLFAGVNYQAGATSGSVDFMNFSLSRG